MTNKRAHEILGMAVTFNGCGRCTSDELEEAIKVAKKALDATEWISVKDRLPEAGKPVLGFESENRIGVWMINSHEDYPIFSEYVTHWMPLPEPPKGAGL